MNILQKLNPFKAEAVDDKKDVNPAVERPVDPHETGGCCGGCGSTQEIKK